MPTSLQIVKQFMPKVKTVKDATRSISITLTPRDVAAAKRKDHNGCAMVEACRRDLGRNAVVSTRTAYLEDDKDPTVAWRFAVSARVHREITAFDRGAEAFAPGEYSLYTPQQPAERGSGTRHKGDPRAGKLRHAPTHTEGVRDSLSSVVPKKGKVAKKRKR